MTKNLSEIAVDCVAEAAYDMKKLDIDALREASQDRVGQEAENACIYYSDCMDVINRYETDVDDSDIDDLVSSKEYKAGEWRDAMTAYANAIAYNVIGSGVSDALTELEEAAENLVEAAEKHGADDVDMDSLRLGRDCPHGWAVHDSEDPEGVHYWSGPNLEGCRAVAVKQGSLWLSYTWTPATVTPEA